MRSPVFLVIDLFCGAGGTTTGFELAELEGIGIAKVIACVNHDPKAIKSHWLNHPEVKHFEEDIRTLDLKELISLLSYYRKKYPSAKVILWASLECTNFSKAKGGQMREADSRTLAQSLYMKWDESKGEYVKGDSYVQLLQPDYIQIENVVEFMSWGPMLNGKPISKKNGEDWLKWRQALCELGYIDSWKELNSANYGAYTSRNRLFGCFAGPDLPIIFPEPTHTKNPGKSMHGDFKKWKAVKEVLHFEDEGESIFTRKKPLSEKTLQRIYAGLVKYIANGDTSFLSKYFSGKPDDMNIPVNQPAHALTTIDHHSLVQASFLLQTYAADSKGHNTFPVDKPARTIATRDSTQLVNSEFLAHYYSNGGETSSVEQPAPTTKARSALVQPEFLAIHNGKSLTRSVEDPSPTIATNDRLALVQPEFFIDKQYGSGAHNTSSVEDPAGTILPYPKQSLVKCEPFIMPTNFDNAPKSIDEPLGTITADRHHSYIVNPSHGGHVTSSDAPCPVIVARQDKVPLYLVQCSTGYLQIEIYSDDSTTMVKIKQFMVVYRIVDIKMRMLRVKELLKIQGFPEDYQMVGNQADHKKFIGNSVVPLVVKAWIEALGMRILELNKNVA